MSSLPKGVGCNEFAEPGDRIEITDWITDSSKRYLNTRATVIEWPGDCRCRPAVDRGEVCCIRHDGTRGFYAADRYKVVKKGKAIHAAQPEKSVEEPKRNLRYDIFRDIFG